MVQVLLAVTLLSSLAHPYHPRYSQAYVAPLIDRVPTYRLYVEQQVAGQVSGKGTPEECSHRIQSLITSALKGLDKVSSRHISPSGVIVLPSMSSLNTLLKEENQGALCLVEFSASWCKQCKEMQPMYDALPYAYRNRPVIFARADVDNFKELVAPTPSPEKVKVLTEQDRSKDFEERIAGCVVCQGTGFIECPECSGKGFVVRTATGVDGVVHSVADICPSCVGHKKIPCPACGGKCYLC